MVECSISNRADVVIQNPDATITVLKEEVFDVVALNERLAELEVRAAAVRADPDCTETIEEAWGDLYQRVVKHDSSPGVTFYPDAIPADRTLVLAAECDDSSSEQTAAACDAGDDGPWVSACMRRRDLQACQSA